MNSEAEANEPSLLERLVRSRNRDASLFLPIILGLRDNNSSTSPRQPDQEPQDSSTQIEARDRIILINPWTQGMVVIEGQSSRLDSLLQDLLSKEAPPPASRAAIEAMSSVEVSEEDGAGECAICLEEWEVGGIAKEMPCKHRFHGLCIEKWLEIHGSCPVCRHKMPAGDDDVNKKSVGDGDGDERQTRGRRREIWVSFSFNRGRSGGANQAPVTDSAHTMET